MDGQVPAFVIDVTRAANAADRVHYASSFFKYLSLITLSLLVELTVTGDSPPPGYLYGAWLLGTAAFIAAAILRWRLDTMAYRAAAAAFGLTALGFGCLALFTGSASASEDQVEAQYMVIVILVGILSYFAWQALSALRMLNLHDGRGQTATIDAADAVSRLYRSTRLRRSSLHWPARPVATLVYAALFVLLLFVIDQLVQTPESHSFSGLMFWLGGGGGSFLVYMIRRNYALGADNLMLRDHRAPLLFLRSFSDDKSRVRAKGGWFAKMRPRTVEESIAGVAHCLGPFVAIANPGQTLPALGAAKSFFTNDTWQQKIQEWIQISQMIVMAAGRTHWVRWELDEIGRAGALDKLIILVPPDPPQDPFRRKTWLDDYFRGTRYAEAVGALAIVQTIALVFREDRLIVIRRDGNRKKEIDYVVAFNMAIHLTRLAPPR